jgi:hypothetical protein
MTAAGGYARLYRGILGHKALKDYAEEAAFGWLVLRAQWQKGRVDYRGRWVDLERGELALSVRDMAKGLRWSLGATQRFIARLQAEKMAEARTVSGLTVLKICNYSTYQDALKRVSKPSHERVTGDSLGESLFPETESDAAESPVESRASHERVTEKEKKESKEDSTPLTKRARAIQEGWKAPLISELPPQAKACASAWPAGAYDRQAEGFVNYWVGRGEPRKDWTATWANWVVRVHPEIMRDVARFAPRLSAPTYRELVREGKA